MFKLNFGTPKGVDASVVKKPEVEQVKVKEKVVFNIMDPGIIKKLASILDCEEGDINKSEFIKMVESSKEGEGLEWYITKVGAKFYMDNKGNITLMSRDVPKNVIERAKEMGMSSI
jgi:hypothetical protein